ncbi:MAG: iduronate-2-sulfatase [Verrucomicrobiaceae bacterium]|nr:MAG: iduronate-2-sulfatase [Verrucomicrobiaceae bacterium]
MKNLLIRSGTLILSALLLSGAAVRAQDTKPNVLLIYIDDLRTELGAYGVSRALTPNLDAFAKQSLLFSNAYCQYPVCGPSRASTLTGLTPDQLGIYGNQAKLRERQPDLLTLPQAFQRAGYETVSVGKVFDQRVRDPQSWNAEYFFKQDDLYAHEENRRIHEKNAANKDGEWKVGPPVEIGREGRSLYEDEKISAKAHEELKRLAAEKKPFFLAVGFHKPHLPFAAPEKYWKMYDRSAIRLPDSKDVPAGSPPVAFWNWLELRAFQGIPKDGPLTDDVARELIHGYLAATSFSDDLAGQLLAEFEKLGLAKDTIVVVLGDNGYHLGELGQWVKYVNTELATHIPLMLHAPGLAPRKVDGNIELIDLYPTLCSLAGVKAADGLKGRDLSPSLKGGSLPSDAPALSQVERPGRAMGYSLRSGNWRYTLWIHPKTGETVGEELYDYSNGGIETVNLADKPEYKTTKDELAAKMKALVESRK